MKLREEHIIKAGGVHYIDDFNTKWINVEFNDDDKNYLTFYNCGDCFNVYLVARDRIGSPSPLPIQLCLIRSRRRFKQLVKIMKCDGE
jgi:hypothetical protein